MKEFTSKENSEIKGTEIKKYQNIKPENGMTYSVAKKIWDNVFGGMNKEIIEESKDGGSYKEVKANSDGSTEEVHHMPSDSVSPVDRMDGPAIKMDKEDHRQTASYGSSVEAKEYRDTKKEKIKNGDFRGAIQMDIDDIKDKFGNKYDKAIEQMLQYVDKLESEGKI